MHPVSEAMNRIEGYFERYFARHPEALHALLTAAPTTARLSKIGEPTRTTDEKRAAVIASAADRNLLYKDIADRLGMNRSTVQKIINRAGVFRKGTGRAKAAIVRGFAGRRTKCQADALAAEIHRLRAETTLTQQGIADRLGVPRYLVAYYLSSKSKFAAA